MSIIVNSISTALEEDSSAAVSKAIALLGISTDAVQSAFIVKTSLDARRRGNVRFIHSVSIKLESGESVVAARFSPPQVVLREEQELKTIHGKNILQHRPIIAGFGPAGIFAGLLLAQNGYRPIILERGPAIEERVLAVESFWKSASFNPMANVQFGEGGAGTFSDGKLTTRIGDTKCVHVLSEFVRFGAPPEILQKAKPHIGTDRIRDVVRNIRTEIIRLGGEIKFNTKLSDIRLENGKLIAAITENGEIPCGVLILAVGHSARDTFETFLSRGFAMEAKPFSVGVRIEHLQKDIDTGLYGAIAGHPSLPTGEYQLSHHIGERGVYTFCMCPGGVVVPASSEIGGIVTNGMSDYARAGVNANSAVVAGVSQKDYGTKPLDGMRFQRSLEQAAFLAGGGKYRAPAQDVGSFLDGKRGLKVGRINPTYAVGIEEGDFSQIFPQYITDILKIGLQAFDRKLHGFAVRDAILTGVETRTSSPVRLMRKENCESSEIQGVYPCAEGAGYAGGIMSAAVDGIRCAMSIMEEYAPI